MNLKDFSELLCLSPTTVSRALNGYPEVGEATRRRVLEEASRHGYRPNLAARRLALGKADAVGIVFPPDIVELGDPGVLGYLRSMSAHLAPGGTDLLVVTTNRKDELATYARLVQGRRVDALVLPQSRVADERVDYLLNVKFPFVTFGRTARCAEHAWLDFDNAAGAAMAVDRLVSFGHARIAYLHAPLELNFAAERMAGFRGAMARAGRPIRPAWLGTYEFALGRRGGYLAMQGLLALGERPTAVLIDSSRAGVGAVRAVLDAGLRPGRDLSIVVQDYVAEDDAFTIPPITSIDHPDERRIGDMLARLVLGVQRRVRTSSLQVLWQPALRVGTTDGPGPPS